MCRFLLDDFQLGFLLFQHFRIDLFELLQLSLYVLEFCLSAGQQGGGGSKQLEALQMKELLHHLRAVPGAQLQKLLKAPLGNDDGALEVFVAESDSGFQLIETDGLPRSCCFAKGPTIGRVYFFEAAPVAFGLHQGPVGCLVGSARSEERRVGKEWRSRWWR